MHEIILPRQLRQDVLTCARSLPLDREDIRALSDAMRIVLDHQNRHAAEQPDPSEG